MAHHDNNRQPSPEEQKFDDLMNRGDDFFKIEIFRSAKAWYLKALDMNMEREKVLDRISECDRLLKYERKVFTVLGVVGAVILVASLVVF